MSDSNNEKTLDGEDKYSEDSSKCSLDSSAAGEGTSKRKRKPFSRILKYQSNLAKKSLNKRNSAQPQVYSKVYF